MLVHSPIAFPLDSEAGGMQESTTDWEITSEFTEGPNVSTFSETHHQVYKDSQELQLL